MKNEFKVGDLVVHKHFGELEISQMFIDEKEIGLRVNAILREYGDMFIFR